MSIIAEVGVEVSHYDSYSEAYKDLMDCEYKDIGWLREKPRETFYYNWNCIYCDRRSSVYADYSKKLFYSISHE